MVDYKLEKTLELKTDKLKKEKVFIYGNYTGEFSLKNLKTIVKNNGGKITNNYETSTLIIYNFCLRPVYNPTINDYHKFNEFPYYIKDLMLDESYSLGELKKFYQYIINKQLDYLKTVYDVEHSSPKFYIFSHIDFLSYLYEP